MHLVFFLIFHDFIDEETNRRCGFYEKILKRKRKTENAVESVYAIHLDWVNVCNSHQANEKIIKQKKKQIVKNA